ncbi:MAG: hypothetical protein ACREKE_04995, partial [bacterium]
MPLNAQQTEVLEGALGQAGEAATNALSGLLGRSATLSSAGLSTCSAADLGEKFFGGVAQVP